MSTTIKPIRPERNYNISEAARALGVNRWTIYSYLRKFPNRLCAFRKSEDSRKQYIDGRQLIKFRENGFPKRGRKREIDG